MPLKFYNRIVVCRPSPGGNEVRYQSQKYDDKPKNKFEFSRYSAQGYFLDEYEFFKNIDRSIYW